MDKKIKGALGKTAAIAGVAAAVIGGGIADDDDAVNELVQKELQGQEPKIEYVDSSEPLIGAELPPIEKEVQAEASTPLWRCIVSVPLWIATHLLNGLLTPVLGKIVGWLFVAAAIVAIVAFGIKSIFPDMPLKDILTKKTLGLSLAGAAVFIVLDAVLGAFCASYIKWKNIFRFVLGLVIVLLVIIRRSRRLSAAKPAKLVLPEA